MVKEIEVFWDNKNNVPPIKVGDIFYDSWGYDQTNLDFIQVVRLSPSGKTAYVKMSVCTSEASGFMSEFVTPTKNVYGPEFKLQARVPNGLNIDHRYLYLVGTYPLLGEGGKVVEEKFRKGYFYQWEGKPLLQTHYA